LLLLKKKNLQNDVAGVVEAECSCRVAGVVEKALKNKRKNRNKKKPTKRVNPHDPQVNPTQTNFKWVGFGLTHFLTIQKSLTHTHILPQVRVG
jgi:hypothetical protein